MTDDEMLVFCGTTCKAAKSLGICARFEDKAFVWFDTMAMTKLRTEPQETKQMTLYRACEQLVDHLSWKKKD